MLWRSSLRPDKLHDFVFSFSRDCRVGNDDFELHRLEVVSMNWVSMTNLLPSWICVKLISNPVAQGCSENVHERSSGGDDVAIPRLLYNFFVNLLIPFALLEELFPEFFLLLIRLLSLLRRAETTCTLLVHLCSRRNTIFKPVSGSSSASLRQKKHTDCDHQEFPRADHVHNSVGVVKDLQHHLLLVCRWRLSLWVSTWMDNTIHVQV